MWYGWARSCCIPGSFSCSCLGQPCARAYRARAVPGLYLMAVQCTRTGTAPPLALTSSLASILSSCSCSPNQEPCSCYSAPRDLGRSRPTRQGTECKLGLTALCCVVGE